MKVYELLAYLQKMPSEKDVYLITTNDEEEILQHDLVNVVMLDCIEGVSLVGTEYRADEEVK